MSPEEAQAFFGDMFGGSDPFGGMFGDAHGGGFGRSSRGGGPGIQFSSNMGGFPGMTPMGGRGGGVDPMSILLSQMAGGGGGGGGGFGMPSVGEVGGMGHGMKRKAAAEPPRYDAIPPGTVVSFKGLTKASERNGDRGVIQRYLPESGRYIVELEDSEETMSVKAVNLLQHVHVTVHDIESKPELNGKTGTILTWLPDKERYNIYVVALKIVISLKPGNVVLDAGTVAQITGVQSKPELNGKWGTIKEWIRESNKYDVQLSAQQVLRLKVENMRV
jgi:hypothetical protein